MTNGSPSANDEQSHLLTQVKNYVFFFDYNISFNNEIYIL